MAYCMAKEWGSPVGTVWGNHLGEGNSGIEKFEVLDSYVLDWARRQGVRSKINEVLFNTMNVGTIVTIKGSDTGGKDFMEYWGYKIHKPTDTWYLTKQAWKRRSYQLKRERRV